MKPRFAAQYRKLGWVVVDRGTAVTYQLPIVAGPFESPEAAQAKADEMNAKATEFMNQLLALIGGPAPVLRRTLGKALR